MLAKAIALHEGFTYNPDEKLFWKQSKGSEKSYLYVTPKFVSKEFVEAIHGTMRDDEYLIIACPSCDSGIKKPNIKMKKIPQAVLGRCEFGKNDYNLNVPDPAPVDDVDDLEDFEDFDDIEECNEVQQKGNKQLSLEFDEDDD